MHTQKYYLILLHLGIGCDFYLSCLYNKEKNPITCFKKLHFNDYMRAFIIILNIILLVKCLNLFSEVFSNVIFSKVQQCLLLCINDLNKDMFIWKQLIFYLASNTPLPWSFTPIQDNIKATNMAQVGDYISLMFSLSSVLSSQVTTYHKAQHRSDRAQVPRSHQLHLSRPCYINTQLSYFSTYLSIINYFIRKDKII